MNNKSKKIAIAALAVMLLIASALAINPIRRAVGQEYLALYWKLISPASLRVVPWSKYWTIGTWVPTPSISSNSTTTGTLAGQSGINYYFRLVALDLNSNPSPASAESVVAVTSTNQAATINWNPVWGADNGYQVWYGTSAGGGQTSYFTVSSTATSYTLATTTGALTGTITGGNAAAANIDIFRSETKQFTFNLASTTGGATAPQFDRAIFVAPATTTIVGVYAVNKTQGDQIPFNLVYNSNRSIASSSAFSLFAIPQVITATTTATNFTATNFSSSTMNTGDTMRLIIASSTANSVSSTDFTITVLYK